MPSYICYLLYIEKVLILTSYIIPITYPSTSKLPLPWISGVVTLSFFIMEKKIRKYKKFFDMFTKSRVFAAVILKGYLFLTRP